MSSVIKKFIIEEYVNGGYGLFNLLDKSEIMGINKSDLLIEIIKELERTENEHDEHCLDHNTDKECPECVCEKESVGIRCKGCDEDSINCKC